MGYTMKINVRPYLTKSSQQHFGSLISISDVDCIDYSNNEYYINKAKLLDLLLLYSINVSENSALLKYLNNIDRSAELNDLLLVNYTNIKNTISIAYEGFIKPKRTDLDILFTMANGIPIFEIIEVDIFLQNNKKISAKPKLYQSYSTKRLQKIAKYIPSIYLGSNKLKNININSEKCKNDNVNVSELLATLVKKITIANNTIRFKKDGLANFIITDAYFITRYYKQYGIMYELYLVGYGKIDIQTYNDYCYVLSHINVI